MNFKRLPIIILFCCLFSFNAAFAQTTPVKPNTTPKYSNESILIYNSGVALQKQGSYDLAEQKYNQTLKMQPNFYQAKENLAILFRTRAYEGFSKGDYDNAILYSQKALPYNTKKVETYYVLGQSYGHLNDYENAILFYNKILAINPNDDSAMHSIASIYLKTNKDKEAQEVYRKILLICPDDKIAQNNLRYANFKHNDNVLAQSLNNLKVEEKAPKKVYRLIKRGRGVSKESKESMMLVLDLVWSEPNGRKMLELLAKNKTPIRILSADKKAQAVHKTQMLTSYDQSGFYSGTTAIYYSTEVEIPIKYINNFNDPNLSARTRVYSMQVFVHEFGHAYMLLNDDNNKNSIEEEVGVSMIGYNLANKVLTGEYLTREQARDYGISCLEGVLSDEHRELPVFSRFNRRIRSYGIEMPYPEEYSDLPAMYKKLRSEDKVVPVKNFAPYVRENLK